MKRIALFLMTNLARRRDPVDRRADTFGLDPDHGRARRSLPRCSVSLRCLALAALLSGHIEMVMAKIAIGA